ncbi:MAG: methylmalonyl Co-A mutase-associated GTPase MeaB [Trueperaceae bacterium]
MAVPDDLSERFFAGDVRALARALTRAEVGDASGRALVAACRRRAGDRRSRVVGVTGAPGAGKSTLVDRLVGAWRDRGARAAVLAVDPSSPFTGGALLGDRVRMTRWSADPGVFVRSMASRGRTGGLAPTALDALTLLEAFGFDVVFLETVGVGQAEVDVVAVADTVVVAIAPGQGDDVQAAKAGLMEIADVFALTKADRPDAPQLAREVRDALALRPADADAWTPAVVPLAAAAAAAASADVGPDGGVAALAAALDAHERHQATFGGGAARRAARHRFEVLVRAERRLRRAAADAAAAGAPGDGDAAGDPADPEAEAVALLRRAVDRDGW